MVKVNKKYKDRLFRMVFNRKEELISLYNAVSHSEYTDPEELEIYTLEDVIYIPVPQFYVFYNGLKEEPDNVELKLSNAFSTLHPELEPCMEFKAVMVNINRGHNKSLMEQCSALREYAEFVARIREWMEAGADLLEAIGEVIDSCIRDGILAEFLSSHRAEVFEVLLTEYDEQRHIASEKELSREEGMKAGLHKAAINLFKRDMCIEEAAIICEEDASLVAEWYEEWKISKGVSR